MRKAFVFAVVFVFSFVSMVLAMDMDNDNTTNMGSDNAMNMTEPDASVNPEQKTEAVNVGNKICPVSGDKIDDEGRKATYEYNGKIYNFCCPMCIETFKKDPEKYIKKVEEELKSGEKQEAKGQEDMNTAPNK